MNSKIEITTPDIATYKRGNHAIDYIHQLVGKNEGPHIVITGLIHGNEICGAIALDHLLRQKLKIKAGILTLIFCNIGAFESFTTAAPYNSRYVEEDMNRIWTEDVLNGPRNSYELDRAREILPLIKQADILLDIHSMSEDCPPLLLCGPSQKGIHFAKNLKMPNYIVSDAGHAAGRRLRDFGDFNIEEKPQLSQLIECGQHWSKASAKMAIQMCYRYLEYYNMINKDDIPQQFSFDRQLVTAPSQKVLQVTEAITVKNRAFLFSGAAASLDLIRHQATLIGYDGEDEVRTPYDNCYYIMPLQGAVTGQTAVRLAKEL
ncbi:MAG: succinylglutamate desuccinylase/aspartoacylase family protein [Alphaproteobacteria bacterium]|nr:succinylglutamate desuccinylase/aspartoacylase family protein [Alphaproteobacteria bacterium]